ncbi:MAG TPA: citryl-CoA lyase [Candidatus Dormibacteraeota bacterium]|nr:citryl-CoA lyase [Candidatus Dormibacteraeota bacterium]
MTRKNKPMRSDIAWSSADAITVKGFDLPNDLMGKANLGDMAFLELMDRLPTKAESILFNAMLVSLVEHGITPSSLATRLTLAGAPEALQAAIAAGLLGLGSVFVGSIEGAARLLQEEVGAAGAGDLRVVAARVVSDYRASGRILPGLGHPVHRPVDPRSIRLFELAARHGLSGRHVELMKLLSGEAERVFERPLPVNATGAIGAIASEMGIPWQAARALGVMARAVGLAGHVVEELRNPLAPELWRRAEEEATAHLRRAPADT